MTKLKPCPKCGNPIIGINTRNYQYQVICGDCDFSTPICFRDYDKAIDLWNSNKTEGETEMTGWQTGIPTKDGLYVIQIHPYGSMNRDPAYACYYIKNGVLKDCVDTEPIDADSFWTEYAIKWKKISY